MIRHRPWEAKVLEARLPASSNLVAVIFGPQGATVRAAQHAIPPLIVAEMIRHRPWEAKVLEARLPAPLITWKDLEYVLEGAFSLVGQPRHLCRQFLGRVHWGQTYCVQADVRSGHRVTLGGRDRLNVQIGLGKAGGCGHEFLTAGVFEVAFNSDFHHRVFQHVYR